MGVDISIIVPLYNESEVYHQLINRLNEVLRTVTFSCEVILVDDGSSDSTPLLIYDTAINNPLYHGVFLSRNFGHQQALSAGLSVARASKAVFIIDGDLQDPPELITLFYEKIQAGADVVYAIRQNRKEGFWQKLAFKAYYRILKSVANIEIPLDAGDFSMLSKKVVDILVNMPEESRYLRGMRSWIGFNQVGVAYDRSERKDGIPKYSFKSRLKLAKNGIFNFSDAPIKLISTLGITTIAISFLFLIIVLIKKIFYGHVIEGYTSLLGIIVLLGGVQLISIGIIGEYILRIFFQTKNRPLFIIKREIVEQKIKE